MGYGIVVWCRDPAVRALVAAGVLSEEGLGSALAEVLGTDDYPSSGLVPLTSGPFVRVGAWSATQRVDLLVNEQGAAVSDSAARPMDPVGETDGIWAPKLGGGAMARRLRDLRGSRALYIQSRMRGDSPTEAVFGPNRVAGSSLASLWWFYADALGLGPLDHAALGRGILDLIDTSLGDGVAVGRHANALNKAGALIARGPVLISWSNNALRQVGSEYDRRGDETR